MRTNVLIFLLSEKPLNDLTKNHDLVTNYELA